MSDEINFNEQQRLKEQSQQKTKKQKRQNIMAFMLTIMGNFFTRRNLV